MARAAEAVAGRPVGRPLPGSAELPRAARRALRRRRRRAGALPRRGGGWGGEHSNEQPHHRSAAAEGGVVQRCEAVATRCVAPVVRHMRQQVGDGPRVAREGRHVQRLPLVVVRGRHLHGQRRWWNGRGFGGDWLEHPGSSWAPIGPASRLGCLEPPKAVRRSLRRCGSRPRALPSGNFDPAA